MESVQDIRAATRILRGTVMALGVVLVAASCEQPYDFGKYENTDLIASQGFDSGDWVLYEPGGGAPDSGEWVTADQAGTYVRFAAVVPDDLEALDVDTSPLPQRADGTAEPVYRLEIPNLFPNGDFEETAAGDRPAQWSETENVSVAQVITGDDAIDGNTLRIQFASADSVYTDLAVLSDQSGEFRENTQYRYRFDFRSVTSELGAELNSGPPPDGASKPGYSWLISRPGVADAGTLLRFPGTAGFAGNTFLLPDNTFRQFSFGGNSADALTTVNAYVDDFRIIRTDVPLHVRLPLPRNAAGRPKLRGGGTYTFTVFVRDDPTVHDPATGGGNRFRASALSVSLNPRPGETTTGAFQTAERTEEWEGWTQLTYRLDGSQLPMTDPVVDVLLMPSWPGTGNQVASLDAGSLLIAAPRLYWSEEK